MKPDPDFYRAKHEAESAEASWWWKNPPLSELLRREYELQRNHRQRSSEAELAQEATKR